MTRGAVKLICSDWANYSSPDKSRIFSEWRQRFYSRPKMRRIHTYAYEGQSGLPACKEPLGKTSSKLENTIKIHRKETGF